MCVNYQTVTRVQLFSHFKVPNQDNADWKAEIWQDYTAPIIIGDEYGRQSLLGLYSMIPKIHIPAGVKRFSTMNARAETIGTLRSYSNEWRNGRLCLVPMMGFYEPNYESGKAVRWKIGMLDESPFAVAGLYRRWINANGESTFSFTQITINSDDDPLMKRFHQPGHEKRSLVILHEHDYDNWLQCRDPDRARLFLKLYPSIKLTAEPAPKETITKT